MNQQQVLLRESNPLKCGTENEPEAPRRGSTGDPRAWKEGSPARVPRRNCRGGPRALKPGFPVGPVSLRAVLGRPERGDAALPSTCPEMPGLPGASPLPPRGLLAGCPHLLHRSGMYSPPLPQQRTGTVLLAHFFPGDSK